MPSAYEKLCFCIMSCLLDKYSILTHFWLFKNHSCLVQGSTVLTPLFSPTPSKTMLLSFSEIVPFDCYALYHICKSIHLGIMLKLQIMFIKV